MSFFAPDPFADKVRCKECRCWLNKSDAKAVLAQVSFGSFTDFYCQKDKPLYSKIVLRGFDLNIQYFAELEVDMKGVPVGYKPIKKV